MPKKQDLIVWRGDSFQARFDMQNENGAARDISASVFVIKTIKQDDGVIVFNKTSGAGGVGSGFLCPTPTNGQLFFSLSGGPAGETIALPESGSMLRYELDEILGDGSRKTRAYGYLKTQDWAGNPP